MSTFTTSIQHSIGSPSHSNQASKRNKRHPNWKGGNKLSLFADDMIVYIENLIDSTRELTSLTIVFRCMLTLCSSINFMSFQVCHTYYLLSLFLSILLLWGLTFLL